MRPARAYEPGALVPIVAALAGAVFAIAFAVAVAVMVLT